MGCTACIRTRVSLATMRDRVLFRPRSRFYAGALCWLCMLAVPASIAAPANTDEAHMWLGKMMQAAQTLNYDGTFVYRQGDRVESMRIIHRADSNGERERLISLSGAPREVLRDNSNVVCILPDTRRVVVGKSRQRSVVPTLALGAGDALTKYYALSITDGDRVAGRTTKVLRIEPMDPYRYGYQLWIDENTGLLLKSELLGDNGGSLEQIVYTSLELPPYIPDTLLEPEISDSGFTRYTTEAKDSESRGSHSQEWRVDWLPKGFLLGEHTGTPTTTGRMPLQHFVYSDGMASLSVFIERLEPDSERLEGLSRMGAVNAYGVLVDGFQVTVVGEVPGVTVESVAKSVSDKQQ